MFSGCSWCLGVSLGSGCVEAELGTGERHLIQNSCFIWSFRDLADIPCVSLSIKDKRTESLEGFAV